MIPRYGPTRSQRLLPFSSHIRANKCASQCIKMSELRDHLEGLRRTIDGFSNLVDECWRSIAKESRALANVDDSVGIKSHESRAGCVGSDRIICKHNLSQRYEGCR